MAGENPNSYRLAAPTELLDVDSYSYDAAGARALAESHLSADSHTAQQRDSANYVKVRSNRFLLSDRDADGAPDATDFDPDDPDVQVDPGE